MLENQTEIEFYRDYLSFLLSLNSTNNQITDKQLLSALNNLNEDEKKFIRKIFEESLNYSNPHQIDEFILNELRND